MVQRQVQHSSYLVSILAALGILLLLVVVFALYFSFQTPLCEDTCSAHSCSGYQALACVEQESGCLDLEPQGLVVGQCGVECLVDDDCFGGVCSSDYVCLEAVESQPVFEPSFTAPVRRVDLCGNDAADLGETCATCPDDVVCEDGYSCRFGLCEKIGMTSTTGVVYCGYPTGSYSEKDSGDDVSNSVVSTYSTCGDAGALVDNQYATTNTRWMCDSVGYPQYAAVQLAEEKIINEMRLLPSLMGNDEFNVGAFRIYFSSDSSNGVDGHWRLVADNLVMPRSYKEPLDVFTDPISTKWVKVEVLGTRNAGDKFAFGEILIYEAPYVCTGDFENN